MPLVSTWVCVFFWLLQPLPQKRNGCPVAKTCSPPFFQGENGRAPPKGILHDEGVDQLSTKKTHLSRHGCCSSFKGNHLPKKRDGFPATKNGCPAKKENPTKELKEYPPLGHGAKGPKGHKGVGSSLHNPMGVIRGRG